MKTVSFILCEKCESPIIKPEDGYIVMGNIYSADQHKKTMYIGDAFESSFPVSENDGYHIKMKSIEMNEKAYCKGCFFRAINLGKHNKPMGEIK